LATVNDQDCPFCAPPPEAVCITDDLAFAMWDAFPVHAGHALIIPRRHIAAFHETTPEERASLYRLLDTIRLRVIDEHHPDGFNIGINEGTAAGQTVDHLHIHLIPRYDGDVANPTGGVRGVIPHKADYRRSGQTTDDDTSSLRLPHQASLIAGGEDALLPHLLAHIDMARHVDVAVAFTMNSGLNLLEAHLRDLLDRKGRLRFLTGDYLDATEPSALRRLHDLAENYPDLVELRAFEAKNQGFHPKTYLFHARDSEGVALVGSSNLSQTGLTDGIEWNYRVVTTRDAQGFGHVLDAFERLFNHPATRPLSAEWISQYEVRRKKPVVHQVPEEIVEDPFAPHTIQAKALAALSETRKAGNQAGLVVLATGLGKTWLSAFDSEGFDRVLFVAHREEILDQAMRTFRRIRPRTHLGKYTGRSKDADADVLFASVQTLSRVTHLRQFAPDHFDYIVMDEFHHAAAKTYRRLIDHFHPQFLLGLTATPERTDGGDLLSLCDENLVFRCDIPVGIQEGLLCPFHYFGVPDDVDYENIPWRSSRFDEEALTQALATQVRAENALEQLRTRGGDRALAFCCSRRHADFMSSYFQDAGVSAVAVHSGDGSAPRTASLNRLQEGELDIIFSVDMFNEGVDLPDVDTILMLRPTESKTLWLQQFGRGLRQPEGVDKTLKVIDYIGNHRTFLNKPEALMHAMFPMGPGLEPVREHLELVRSGEAELPPGCEITYETEAIDLLQKLFPQKRDIGEGFYQSWRTEHGERPLASETYQAGYNPRTLGQGNGGWLHFVAAMGDMTNPHLVLLAQRAGRFLTLLDSTSMTRSYKMLLLRALVRRNALPGEMSIDDLTEAFAAEASRNQYLRDDVSIDIADRGKLKRLIIDQPIKAWTGAQGSGNETFFEYQDGVFRCSLEIPDDQRDAFAELVGEMIEWRLAAYLDRARGGDRILCKVSHSSGRPILFLPDRDKEEGIPWGATPVEVQGVAYEADFVKIAVNVLRRQGSGENTLPTVLRGWFGEEAGQSGTTHKVAFVRTQVGYRLEPLLAATGPELWRKYMREEIPPLFGLEFSKGLWQQGFIRKDGHIFLLVTLEKGGQQKQFQYDDRFLSPTEFQWQSQNQTARDSNAGRAIQQHEAEGTLVHLFVRQTKLHNSKAAPFRYCGELQFVSWEEDKPITVQWRLQSSIPPEVKVTFQ
jgi:superfamily II DNA or RNA helicase/HKD family nuclease